MTYYELFFLAVGLCFDTFAVSLSGGTCPVCYSSRRWLTIICTFALFQSGMTVIGWWLGSGMEQLIHDYDHWVAFALLLLIGGKMTVESFGNKEQKTVNLLNNKILITAAIATSIDALAIGISLALIQLSITRIAMGGLIIAAVTAIASFIGLHSGRRLGKKFGRWAELTGGVILIGLGIKIVLEHTGIL